MNEEITRELDVRSSSVALWFGALTGPLMALIDQLVKYAIVQYACQNRAEWIFWVTAAVTLIITIISGFVAFPYTASEEKRIRFMAWADLGLAAMFSIVIIAMAIPDLYIHACD